MTTKSSFSKPQGFGGGGGLGGRTTGQFQRPPDLANAIGGAQRQYQRQSGQNAFNSFRPQVQSFQQQLGQNRNPYDASLRQAQQQFSGGVNPQAQQAQAFQNQLQAPQISPEQHFQNMLEGGGTPQGQSPQLQQAQAFQQQLGGGGNMQQALAQAMAQAQQQFPGINSSQGGLMQQQLQQQKMQQALQQQQPQANPQLQQQMQQLQQRAGRSPADLAFEERLNRPNY